MMISRMSRVLAVVSLAAGLPVCAFAADTPAPPAPAAPAPAPAPAGGGLPTPVIMVVDVQRILQESTAAKGVSTAIESQRDTYQKEIEALETKLRSAEADLVKQKTVLAPEAFSKRQSDFQKQVGDLQRTVQTRKRALDTALDTSMVQVQKAMVDVIGEVAIEKGANIVVARHQFIIHATAFDQTDIVLKRLNERLPKVEVTIPKQ
jgi:outer membrane protein